VPWSAAALPPWWECSSQNINVECRMFNVECSTDDRSQSIWALDIEHSASNPGPGAEIAVASQIRMTALKAAAHEANLARRGPEPANFQLDWREPRMLERNMVQKVRRICLALPEAVETVSFGHPTFRAGKKTFAVVEEYKGIPSLALNAGTDDQEFLLRDDRFYRTPYAGNRGWVSLRLDRPFTWREVGALARLAYRHVASRRMIAALEEAT
jgi:predicted DNA-binding protein (MmcQ/YjbR family)